MSVEEKFLSDLLERRQEISSGEKSLRTLRQKGWERFLQLGLPNRKRDGAFQYVPLSQLYAREIFQERAAVSQPNPSKYIYPECRESYLVFAGSSFRPDLSDRRALPEQIVVSTLSQALSSYGHFLQGHFLKSFKEEGNPFTCLNLALHEEGLFIYIPPGIQCTSPIQILYLMAEGAMPRLQILVGAGSTVQMISIVVGRGGEAIWTNRVTDLSLEEKASLHHVDLLREGEKSLHFHSLRARLKRESSLQTFEIISGIKMVRSDYRAALLGENAAAELNGIWMLREKEQAHTHILMEHLAPSARSMQNFRGVLDENSQSSFEGKIFVDQKAQKTESYQLNRNLILSEGAIANSKPSLEIFADDVKASHGATVGQIDPSQLFYLKSRGIPESLAKRMLVFGFCQEIIDQLPHSFLREEIMGTLDV
jgi:Fe-S cluster assembly protein SufD